jgi:hypothetical protein
MSFARSPKGYKIFNKSHFRTRDLRRLIEAAVAFRGRPKRLGFYRVTWESSRVKRWTFFAGHGSDIGRRCAQNELIRCFHGLAYRYGVNIVMKVPSCVRMAEAGYITLPRELTLRLAKILIHEMDHVLGLRHADMIPCDEIPTDWVPEDLTISLADTYYESWDYRDADGRFGRKVASPKENNS